MSGADWLAHCRGKMRRLVAFIFTRSQTSYAGLLLAPEEDLGLGGKTPFPFFVDKMQCFFLNPSQA